MPTELDDLVQQAEQMMVDIQGDTDLPRITRSLEQMRQQGERLYSRGAHSDVKAARLLGSKAGFELPSSLAHKLELIESSTAVDAFEDVTPDTDIQTFLKKEREMILLSAIEQTRRSTFEESDSRSEKAIQQWWEQEKQKILTTLAGSASGSGPDLPELQSIIGQENMEITSAGDRLTAPSRTALTQTELHYCRQVDKFLNNQDQELSELLSSGYISAPSIYGSPNGEFISDPEIAEFWHHVNKFNGMPRRANSRGSASGSESSANVLKSRCDTWMQRQGVRCAIEELEYEMLCLMRSAVEAAPNEAQLGGRPGTIPLVKAFLKIKMGYNSALYSTLEDGAIENRPIWPMIYYCMRCGDFSKALEIAKKATSNLGRFPMFLEHYVDNDRSLSHTFRTEMRHVYKRSVRQGTDPFKRLVYCMIGSCDPSENHTEVASSIMDFLWLKLHQLTWDDLSKKSLTADTSHNEDILTLPQLQKLLFEDYGETHFEAWRQPLLYFKILFLTQQFEAALAFLSRFEPLRCHAVHAALVLKQSQLLILSKNVQDQLLSRDVSDPDGIRRLNLARLIMIYTRKFEVTDTRDALNYFYFLNDLQLGEENVFFKCIAELVIETREFDLILGYIDESGRKHSGALHRFGLDTCKLISHVAEMLENRGLVLEASKLFELAGDMDKSIGLTNQVLAAKITQTPDLFERIQIVERATKLGLCLRQQSAYNATTTNAKGLYFLLDLCGFFDLIHNSDFETALNVMDSLRLLPTKNESENLNARIRTFNQLPEEIRRIMPQILLATMRCIKARMNLTRSEMNRSIEDFSSSPLVKDVLERAKALVTFAGRLPYRMPGEVYVKLSQMEMELV